MRKQYLIWSIAVFGIFGTVYGAYLVAYHFNHGNGINVGAVILLAFGLLFLVTFITLYTISYFQNKKAKETAPIEAEVIEEKVVEPIEEEPKPSIKTTPSMKQEEYVSRSNTTYSSYDVSTIYVKQVGYGPLLRVEGNRIIDMRTNTYYRIENNMVKQEGSGPVFEIRGNQIKNAFGGFLYELSGSNINKVYGGFYASISGNYITLFDLSVKYETTGQLSKNQTLAVAALLFGKY